MVVHRRQLPIADPCAGFLPAPGSARGHGGFCERCQKEVHDLSSLRESELRAFMDAHAGTQVCVAYHVDAHGYLRLRPELRPVSLGALALLLAACAGHLPEAEAPGSVCRDLDGYQVECPGWGDAEVLSVPEEPAVEEGCPVRPTADGPDGAEPPVEDPRASDEPSVDPIPEAPEQEFTREIVVKGSRLVVGAAKIETREEYHGFVPTAYLWHEWRQRRAEHRAARARWRASRRKVTAGS